jgi:hypothetical protein
MTVSASAVPTGPGPTPGPQEPLSFDLAHLSVIPTRHDAQEPLPFDGAHLSAVPTRPGPTPDHPEDGLTPWGLDPAQDMARTLPVRCAAWRAVLQPENPVTDYCCEQYCRESLHADRLERELLELQRQNLERWSQHWDRERRIQAEALAEQLRAAPARIVRELQRTLQGCDLLIERWQGLAAVLGPRSAWTAAQAQLAFDLLGVPLELRHGNPLLGGPLPSDPSNPQNGSDGGSGADPETCRQLTQTQLEQLQAARSALVAEDARARALAARGLGVPASPAETKMQRQLHAARTRMRHYYQILTRRGRATAPVPAAAPPASAAAPPAARPPRSVSEQWPLRPPRMPEGWPLPPPPVDASAEEFFAWLSAAEELAAGSAARPRATPPTPAPTA